MVLSGLLLLPELSQSGILTIRFNGTANVIGLLKQPILVSVVNQYLRVILVMRS